MRVTSDEQLIRDQQYAGARMVKKQNTWRRLQTRIRKKRFEFFKSFAAAAPRPLSILDVGGTQVFWEKMQFIRDDIHIVIYNVSSAEMAYPNLSSVAGDARDMKEFKDQQF